MVDASNFLSAQQTAEKFRNISDAWMQRAAKLEF
jgi:hypothetical protein